MSKIGRKGMLGMRLKIDCMVSWRHTGRSALQLIERSIITWEAQLWIRKLAYFLSLMYPMIAKIVKLILKMYNNKGRVCQHLGISDRTHNFLIRPIHSEPRNHSLQCSSLLTADQFSIIDQCSNSILTLESLHIKQAKPSLNLMSSSTPLLVAWLSCREWRHYLPTNGSSLSRVSFFCCLYKLAHSSLWFILFWAFAPWRYYKEEQALPYINVKKRSAGAPSRLVQSQAPTHSMLR